MQLPNEVFDWFEGAEDPATTHYIARETSWALLDRVRSETDPTVVERVLAHAQNEGVDDIAEMWANAHKHSLAGTLWRLYLLRKSGGIEPRRSRTSVSARS